MTNKTKAELINEIKALQAAVKANEQWRRENNSEIKDLREMREADDEMIGKQANEIEELQNLVDSMCIAARDFRKEIKLLRDQATCDAFEVRELRNQIRDLQADAVHDANELDKKSNEIEGLRADKWRLYDLEDEYRSEIKRLEQTARARLDTISVMSKKISKLQKAYNEINGAFGSSLRSQLKKDNEIKDLRHDYDNRQAIITEMRSEINELEARVADLEQKRNDSRKFYWATEALGNPEHFQEVT